MKYDICVFGGCALDQFYYKNAKGEIPECPSLVLPGGKGSNQAVAAAKQNVKTYLIGNVGNDIFSKDLTKNNIKFDNK